MAHAYFKVSKLSVEKEESEEQLADVLEVKDTYMYMWQLMYDLVQAQDWDYICICKKKNTGFYPKNEVAGDKFIVEGSRALVQVGKAVVHVHIYVQFIYI